MTELLLLFISTLVVNNYVLTKILGLCPFLGVTKKVENSVGMGLATMFVITVASLIAWFVDVYILTPLQITYLRTVIFILIIAALVQLSETIMEKTTPALYQSLGIYLPLITTNCAVLAVPLLIMNKGYNFWETLVYAIGAPAGFYLALMIISMIRENLAFAKIPRVFQGAAISLITTGILALAFMGFSGLIRE
ncbi:MAG: electron transport complex subunit RsxA [Nitrospiria bacterium]